MLLRHVENSHGLPIPVLSIADFNSGHRIDGFREVIDATNKGVALRLTLDETTDTSLATRIQVALRSVVARPDQTILIVDGSNSHLDSETTTDVVASALLNAMEIGLWRRIVFQATSYPETNPATAGSMEVLPRPEFGIWCRVREHDSALRNLLMYGDFGADSAKFHFRSGKCAPIPHFRISTQTEWLVSRGEQQASFEHSTKSAAKRIVEDKRYAGRAFSWGDNFLYERAASLCTPGMAWRAVNMNHHLTQVLAGIGALEKFGVGAYAFTDSDDQSDMFANADKADATP